MCCRANADGGEMKFKVVGIGSKNRSDSEPYLVNREKAERILLNMLAKNAKVGLSVWK